MKKGKSKHIRLIRVIKKIVKETAKILGYILLLCLAFYGLWNIIPEPVRNFIVLWNQYKEINKQYQQTVKTQKMLNTTAEPTHMVETRLDLYGRPVQVIPLASTTATPKIVSAGSDKKFNTKDDIIISETKLIAKEVAETTLKKYFQQKEYVWSVNWMIKKYENHLYTLMYKYWEINPFVIISNIPSGDTHISDITITLLIGEDGKYGEKHLDKDKVLEIINTTQGTVSIMPEFKIKEILEVKTTECINCQVKIEYKYGGQEKSAVFTHQVVIHPVDDFNWSFPEMLACFVNSTSSNIQNFVNKTVIHFEEKIANRKIRKTGLLFYITKLVENQLKNVKKEFFFLSCAKAIDVDPILAVIPSEKKFFTGVAVEKIKSIRIEVDKTVVNIREFVKNIPVVQYLTYVLPQPVIETYSSKLFNCYTENDWLILDLDKNSFLDACQEGGRIYNIYFDAKKLNPVEVKQAWTQGYLPPDIPVELNLRIPDKKEIEKIGGKELQDIFEL